MRTGGDLQPVADAPRPAGFRFDVGVFDEAGGVRAGYRHDIIRRQRRFRRPAPDKTTHQHVPRPLGMDRFCVLGQRGLRCQQCGQLRPGDGEIGKVQRFHHGRRSYDRSHGLALEAASCTGENRLIGQLRDDTKAVASGDIVGGEHRFHTGMNGARQASTSPSFTAQW